jgi:hypothetical protein
MRVAHHFAPKVVTDPVEALRRVVYDHHALEACAQAVGVSHQTLSKQLNPDEESQVSLRRAAALEGFLDTDALAMCFAARRGGVFYKLPQVQPGVGVLNERFAVLLREFGQAVQAFSDGMGNDGHLDTTEVDRLEMEGQEVIAEIVRLVSVARAELVRRGEA